jgi:hypothetical protein
MNPGHTINPSASMTCSASEAFKVPIFDILPLLTPISALNHGLAAPLIILPFFIMMLKLNVDTSLWMMDDY